MIGKKTFVIFVSLILVCGCSSIQPKPFEDFSKTLSKADTSIDSVMSKNYEWEKQNFYDEFLDTKETEKNKSAPHLSDLRIKRNEAFQLTTPDQLFTTIGDTRLTLKSVNDATIKYANLLATLAGAELIDPKAFEGMAKDVNNSMNSIFKTLDAKVGGDAIPVFSLAAVETTRLAVEHQRRKELAKVLRSGQPSIEKYSSKVISLIGTLEQSLSFSYGKRFDHLSAQFRTLPAGDMRKNKDAAQLLDEALKLNDEYSKSIYALLDTKRIYESLPGVHKELLGYVENTGTGMQGLNSISQSVIRLDRIYTEMTQSSQKNK